ncbi:MAG: HAMP domain-containing histidine kinase, partial [Campylobacter sp.]|nr:HAMP domain-containing histidine kinase [Campylobacter sp.]
IYTSFKPLFAKLIGIFIICILITYFISKRFNRHINKEIASIQHFLSRVSTKNYNVAISRSPIKEFDTISRQLTHMKNNIESSDIKLAKRSAKIRLKNTQLEGILSSISHEFKNPIAIITASAQTLEKNPDISKEDKQKFIDKIVKNSEKLVILIDKLKIAFVDNFSLKTEDVALKALSNEVAKELMECYKGRKILINGKETIIKADKDMIRQVIQNLSENALKYSNNNIQIELSPFSLIIKDSGVGISKEDQKFVGKKFFRVDKNSWNNSLGLGLYIVKNIIKLHNFELIVESELDKGSEFGFKFPSSKEI